MGLPRVGVATRSSTRAGARASSRSDDACAGKRPPEGASGAETRPESRRPRLCARDRGASRGACTTLPRRAARSNEPLVLGRRARRGAGTPCDQRPVATRTAPPAPYVAHRSTPRDPGLPNAMTLKITKLLMTIGAVAALAAPAGAQARNGADDATPHARHTVTQVRHHKKARKHHVRRADDARARHARGRADDGPTHR